MGRKRTRTLGVGDIGPVSLDRYGDVLIMPEVSAVLRTSLDHCYDLIKEGKLPCLRLGRRIVVPKVMLETFLKGA